MSNNNNKPSIRYCVHCGADVNENQIYCPKCGKLVLKMKSDKIESISEITEEPAQIKTKEDFTRKCPGCGSIISSPILEQCPICNTKLEKLPKSQKSSPEELQKSSGFIFTNKKLIPEQKLILKKESWNLREGIGVFGNSLMAYITIRLLIIMLLTSVPVSEEVNIFEILLSQIPEIIFGVYPLWYIYSKKHSFKKLGFDSSKKSILIAIVVGIIGAIILYEINFFSDIIVDIMYNSGIKFGFDLPAYIASENQAIREAGLLWIILLIVLLNIGTISSEIVFRGVLHNTLKNHFENDLIGRITVIIIVALVYTLLFLVFSLPVSLYFFLLYFLNALFLGIIYEMTNNIYNTIIANISYNLILVIIIVLF